MRQFKKVDCLISILLIIVFFIASIIDSSGFLNTNLLIGYTVVGLWQSISMIVHAVRGYFTKKWGARFIYHWISFIAVVTIPAGSVWILYFAAPFMAVYYTYLCYHEVTVKMQRPLALLK